MSTAYFAGAGTVAIAVVLGLGGGLLIAEVMSPKSPAMETAKLERRTDPQPAPSQSSVPASEPVSGQPANPAPSSASTPVTSASTSPYLLATQGAATTPIVVKRAAADQAAADTPAPQPQPSPLIAAAPPQPAVSEPASASSRQQQANAPEAALAKASEADLKSTEAKSRDTDTRRAERERRRSERHQQWAERRRQRHDADPRPDLRDVEQAVRQDSEPRTYVVDRAGPSMAPRFNLFDEND
jgi:hypothetical protein